MSAQPVWRVDAAPVADDEQNHVYCCFDVDTALCGMDISSLPICEDEDTTCQTCDRLDLADTEWIQSGDYDETQPCPHCPLNVLGGAS